MNFLCLTGIGAACAGLAALLIGLSGCGGGSSSSGNLRYSLAVSALNPGSITGGNTSTSTITLIPAGGYSGSVTLSCAAISGMNAPTCAFNPNPVSVKSNDSSTLTVSTGINTPGGNYTLSFTGKEANNLSLSNGAQPFSVTIAAVIQRVGVIF